MTHIYTKALFYALDVFLKLGRK